MHLAAEEIDHQVLIAHDAGEILAIEGDHVIRAERADIVSVGRTAGDRDDRAAMAGELDARAADRAGARRESAHSPPWRARPLP